MYTNIFTLLALMGLVKAHMHLEYPPTLLGDNNPFTPPGKADPQLNYPYGCCGSKVTKICKGHLPLLDQDEGQPTATWAAGQKANFTLSGHRIKSPIENPEGGTHAGGSCLASMSIDKGQTFRIVRAWQGNCPNHDQRSLDPQDHVFNFDVPSDLPAGNAVFAWSWVNREQEFNMNCASVMITRSDGDNEESPEQPSTTPLPQTPDREYKYSLEGCTCSCPHRTWDMGCKCFNCGSPSTNRRAVERKALSMHKRNMERADILEAPRRRTEDIAFKDRPLAPFNIDLPGSECKSLGNPVELRWPNPGPDVVEKDGNDGYELGLPICGAV